MGDLYLRIQPVHLYEIEPFLCFPLDCQGPMVLAILAYLPVIPMLSAKERKDRGLVVWSQTGATRNLTIPVRWHLAKEVANYPSYLHALHRVLDYPDGQEVRTYLQKKLGGKDRDDVFAWLLSVEGLTREGSVPMLVPCHNQSRLSPPPTTNDGSCGGPPPSTPSLDASKTPKST